MLLTLRATHGEHVMTIEERGTKMSNSLVGVDSLVLYCEAHGKLAEYSMISHPKYSVAKHKAMSEGAAHAGVDKLVWLC